MLHDINLKIDAGEYRLAADDPDEENTLATAVFTLDANHVRWQIFDINRDDAKFQGEVRALLQIVGGDKLIIPFC